MRLDRVGGVRQVKRGSINKPGSEQYGLNEGHSSGLTVTAVLVDRDGMPYHASQHNLPPKFIQHWIEVYILRPHQEVMAPDWLITSHVT